MVIALDPELEAALNEHARRRGVAAEDLALQVLRSQLVISSTVDQPQDEWERRLLGLAKDCGVSLSDTALTRETLYE